MLLASETLSAVEALVSACLGTQSAELAGVLEVPLASDLPEHRQIRDSPEQEMEDWRLATLLALFAAAAAAVVGLGLVQMTCGDRAKSSKRVRSPSSKGSS